MLSFFEYFSCTILIDLSSYFLALLLIFLHSNQGCNFSFLIVLVTGLPKLGIQIAKEYLFDFLRNRLQQIKTASQGDSVFELNKKTT